MLTDELTVHFHLPSEGMLKETLIGWLGIEPWTQKDGDTVEILPDGGVRVLKKVYAKNTSASKFLQDIANKPFKTLYDKEMKEISSLLHELARRTGSLASRVPHAGWMGHHSAINKEIITTQAQQIHHAGDLLNTLANYYSMYR